jgi:hypothetical protein
MQIAVSGLRLAILPHSDMHPTKYGIMTVLTVCVCYLANKGGNYGQI